MGARAFFAAVPPEHLAAWVEDSLDYPTAFPVTGVHLYGYVQRWPGAKSLDVFGYLSILAGYPGSVRVPMYSEAKMLWEQNGYGEIDHDDWILYQIDVSGTTDPETWRRKCRKWFGLEPIGGLDGERDTATTQSGTGVVQERDGQPSPLPARHSDGRWLPSPDHGE